MNKSRRRRLLILFQGRNFDDISGLVRQARYQGRYNEDLWSLQDSFNVYAYMKTCAAEEVGVC